MGREWFKTPRNHPSTKARNTGPGEERDKKALLYTMLEVEERKGLNPEVYGALVDRLLQFGSENLGGGRHHISPHALGLSPEAKGGVGEASGRKEG